MYAIVWKRTLLNEYKNEHMFREVYLNGSAYFDNGKKKQKFLVLLCSICIVNYLIRTFIWKQLNEDRTNWRDFQGLNVWWKIHYFLCRNENWKPTVWWKLFNNTNSIFCSNAAVCCNLILICAIGCGEYISFSDESVALGHPTKYIFFSQFCWREKV